METNETRWQYRATTFPSDRTRQLSDEEAKLKLAKKYELLDPDVRLMLQVKAGDAAVSYTHLTLPTKA